MFFRFFWGTAVMSFPDKLGLGSLRHVDVIAGFNHHFNRTGLVAGQLYMQPKLTPLKTKMTGWKNNHFEGVSPIENGDFFHCHVSFLEGDWWFGFLIQSLEFPYKKLLQSYVLCTTSGRG